MLGRLDRRPDVDEPRLQTVHPARQHSQLEMKAEDEQYRRDNQLLTIESLLRQHATLIEATHGEVQEMKQVILQITDKINALDTYAKAVGHRLIELRDGIQSRYEPTFVDLSARVHELERPALKMRGMARPGIALLGSL